MIGKMAFKQRDFCGDALSSISMWKWCNTFNYRGAAIYSFFTQFHCNFGRRDGSDYYSTKSALWIQLDVVVEVSLSWTAMPVVIVGDVLRSGLDRFLISNSNEFSPAHIFTKWIFSRIYSTIGLVDNLDSNLLNFYNPSNVQQIAVTFEKHNPMRTFTVE